MEEMHKALEEVVVTCSGVISEIKNLWNFYAGSFREEDY